MDRVGNRRYGVPLPYHYWTRRDWTAAFDRLGWRVSAWVQPLALYPWLADLVFGRNLHFIALVHPPYPQGDRPQTESTHTPVFWTQNHAGVDELWEDAYLRFETPAEEVRKFLRRLRMIGAMFWPRTSRILEICCGRGSGLVALERLGFEHLEGVDLSPRLLRAYRGPARLYVGDCRHLNLDTASRDIVVVQGGLHHLSDLPEDLRATLSEAHRVLRPGGRFVCVEPWPTAFLHAVHLACRLPLLRAIWPRLDAFGRMVERETPTYASWLSRSAEILSLIEEYFEPDMRRIGWGKLIFSGTRKAWRP